MQRTSFATFLVFGLIAGMANGEWQGTSAQSGEAAMRAHYDAAYRLQSEGHLAEADVEHEAFLSIALSRVANGYANTGDYAHAKPIYEEALSLAPRDFELITNYAAASIDAKEYEKVRGFLSAFLQNRGSGRSSELSRLWRMLGDADLALGHKEDALRDYAKALNLDRGCENVFAIASARLSLSGTSEAAAAFSQFFSQCGDSSVNHFKVGRTMALDGLPERAVTEFKQAIAQGSAFPGLHYSLGAAYLSHSRLFDLAVAEFHKELALYPNDRYCYAQLGRIAFARHQFREAETDYRRAIASNPMDPSSYIQLGQLLSDQDRRPEAESLLKRAIELTVDPSKDNYAVEKAHFILGRMLLRDGRNEEGKQELEISKQQLDRSRQDAVDVLSVGTLSALSLARTRVPTPSENAENERYASRMAPLIAGSYNNIGAHAAMANSFADAATYFRQAAKWNSKLAGVDINWGRAAFFAHRCDEAVAPLERSLLANPGDLELGNMLAVCRRQVTTTDGGPLSVGPHSGPH